MLTVFLEDFLDSTSVHGFAYLHSRTHWVWRVFWVSMAKMRNDKHGFNFFFIFLKFLTIIGGFGLAIHTIYFSFLGWSENPVITTLDTITAPIHDVQFPTITACADSQPDNWAFLENVLNNVALECHVLQDDCEQTKQVRNDFGYMFERIGTDFEDYLYQDHFNDSHNLVNVNELHGFSFDIVAETILEKTENKEYRERKLYGMPAKYFGMNDYVVEDLMNYFNESEQLNRNYHSNFMYELLPKYCPNSTEACKNVLSMWHLTYTLATSSLKFGTFLKNIVHNHGFVSFNMKSKVQDIAKRFSLGQYSDICKTMVKTEKDLQEYLTSLSKLVGFEVSESVSLYELPSLLAKDTDANNWPPVMNHLFLYTLCERDYNTPDDEFSYYMNSGLTMDKFDLAGSCFEEWNRFFGGKNLISKIFLYALENLLQG